MSGRKPFGKVIFNVSKNIFSRPWRANLRGTSIKSYDFLALPRILDGRGLKNFEWYEFLKSTPPKSYVRKPGKLRKLTFPEDRLRRKWFRRHPAVHEPNFMPCPGIGDRLWNHPVQRFVYKQKKLMDRGYTEDEAYSMTERDEKLERETIRVQKVAAMEEAIDMYQTAIEDDVPYPKVVAANQFTAHRLIDLAAERESDAKILFEQLEDMIEARRINSEKRLISQEEVPKGITLKMLLIWLRSNPKHKRAFEFGKFDFSPLTSSIKEKEYLQDILLLRAADVDALVDRFVRVASGDIDALAAKFKEDVATSDITRSNFERDTLKSIPFERLYEEEQC
eukprot:TRINITY_DN18516_c0_g1_i1.p1 TRINITY_DN18516_c0_g1~~TRINITY_DN18516_c0_g1_i1.p1  ORF type:complete len:337 (+),score=74.00 TRINITY_DN18516_c0_g1_i1:46-1056(+)